MISEVPTQGLITMTEQDWGRFYTLDANGGVILPPRGYYLRNMDVGNWTDLIIGMTYCVQKNDTPDNTAMVAEQLLNTGSTNLFHFGLADNKLELTESQNFLGIRGIAGTGAQLIVISEQLTFNKVTQIKTGTITQNGGIFSVPMRTAHVADDAFCSFGIRFTFNRLNNTLYVNRNQVLSEDPTDLTDITVLKAFMQAIPNTPNNAVSFSNFVSSKAFTAIFIYWPFLLNRFKIHCIGAIKME